MKDTDKFTVFGISTYLITYFICPCGALSKAILIKKCVFMNSANITVEGTFVEHRQAAGDLGLYLSVLAVCWMKVDCFVSSLCLEQAEAFSCI